MMLSLVIPVFNEVESLAKLHAEICAVTAANNYDFEIVFVDDGSRDGSWEEIEKLSAADPRVSGLQFRRNFGKAAALSAGFSVAKGDIIFTLDADLQDDPQEIPRFLEKMAEGYDCVSGWKEVRHDPWHKVGPSRVFNGMVGWLTGVKLHDHNCGFKCYRQQIFDDVRLYGELHRFVPVLAAAHGWRVNEIIVKHRARQFGHSKYGVKRIVKGFLDLLTVHFLTDYGQRPQHLLGGFGLFCFSFGGAGAAFLAIWWILSRVTTVFGDPVDLHQKAIFYYSLTALILGAQFMLVGFLAELMTFHAYRDYHPYSIKKHVGNVPPSPTEQPPDDLPLA